MKLRRLFGLREPADDPVLVRTEELRDEARQAVQRADSLADSIIDALPALQRRPNGKATGHA